MPIIPSWIDWPLPTVRVLIRPPSLTLTPLATSAETGWPVVDVGYGPRRADPIPDGLDDGVDHADVR